MFQENVHARMERLQRIDRALEAQRSYIQRVPDPDNRYRAETNLLTLLEMREASAFELEGVQPVSA